MTPDRIEAFLREVTRWASSQMDVLALALVGSHARGSAREASDLDLVLICTRPADYLQNTDWVDQFGSVSKQQVEDYGLLTSLRVWYKDGPEVEFGLTDTRWAALPLDEGTRRVMADGLRVLFEKDNTLSRYPFVK